MVHYVNTVSFDLFPWDKFPGIDYWVKEYDHFWHLSHICHILLSKYYAAAAAAKSLQSCPTLCDPIDGSPPGSALPGILQARTLEWAAISFSNF